MRHLIANKLEQLARFVRGKVPLSEDKFFLAVARRMGADAEQIEAVAAATAAAVAAAHPPLNLLAFIAGRNKNEAPAK